jgi:hypothetical protein
MHYSRVTFSLVALALLCGCPTAAQRQFQAMKTNNQQAASEIKSCGIAVYNSPEAGPIRVHVPYNIADATLEQLSDKSLATPSEVQAMLALHPKTQECRKAFLNSVGQSEPSLVPILIASYNRSDDDVLAVIQRRMTWGDRVRRARDRAPETQAAVQAADQRVVSGLNQEHQAEMAQRQRAAEAMAAWAQNQQMINAINRPVITNCSGFGNMVNCVSR